MKVFMLDNNIFDKIIKDEELKLRILNLKNKAQIKLVITTIQIYEFNSIENDPEKREHIRIWTNENCEVIDSIGFLLDISICGDRLASEVELEKLAKGNIKHNKDAVIALTSESDTDFLVTNDARFSKRVKKELPKVQVLNFDEFSEMLSAY